MLTYVLILIMEVVVKTAWVSQKRIHPSELLENKPTKSHIFEFWRQNKRANFFMVSFTMTQCLKISLNEAFEFF